MKNGTIDLDLNEGEELQEITATEIIPHEEETTDPFLSQLNIAKKYKDEAMAIVITSPDQIEEISRARELRLELKNIRCDVEKQRKSLKESVLREGKAIDGFANIVKFMVVPLEEHLQAQEDFSKIQEEKIKAELKEKREAELLAVGLEDASFYNLAEMPEEQYDYLFANTKHSFEITQAKEREEEAARIKQEQDDLIEQERIKEQNKLLLKEKEAADKKKVKGEERQSTLFAINVNLSFDECADMTDKKWSEFYKGKKAEFDTAEKEKTETAAQEKKDRDDKEELERLEREKIATGKSRVKFLYEIGVRHDFDECADMSNEQWEKFYTAEKAKYDAEQLRLANVKKAEKAKELAPDKDKLEAFAVDIMLLDTPVLKNAKANEILQKALKMLSDVSGMIKQESIKL